MPMSPGLMRNRGIFGSATPQQMAAPQQMAKNTSNGQTEKRGFDWSKLLGVLGDSLSIAGGGQATFVPGLLEQRQRQQALAYAAQQQEKQRQQGLQDWVWKQQYEAAHPKPINNDTVADYQFIVQILGEAAGKEFLRNKANPPQYRQGPDGQFYRIDTSPTGAPPTFTAQDWDNAAPMQGGQSATPTGGFRQFP